MSEAELGRQLQYYKDIAEMRVAFRQTKHLAEMSLDLPSKGELTVKRPDVIRWSISEPSKLTVDIDPNAIKITDADGKTQTFRLDQISKENAARSLSLLRPWLLMDVHALNESYVITKEGARGYAFAPKDTNAAFTRMEITLAKAGHLERLLLREKSGDHLDIQFDSPKVTRRAKP